MKKIALVLALAMIASCFCVLLTGCSGGDNEFIGTWRDGYYDDITYTFENGGKCTITNFYENIRLECKYKITEGNKITIDQIPFKYVVLNDYKIDLYLLGVNHVSLYKLN